MSMLCRLLPVLALAVLLAGCTNFSSVKSGMPEQEVRAKLGAPKGVWKNPDGSETWEYPLGPLGRQTFMVTIGSDHAMREIHQVLSDEYFSKVQAGMSRDDVGRILGRPGEIAFFDERGEETWSWRYQKEVPMIFHVMFDRSAGTVRSTLRLQEILIQTEGGR
ncbi:MAG TPA: outer membrane protein assembly factor BamE [Burkholderiales bacterium]